MFPLEIYTISHIIEFHVKHTTCICVIQFNLKQFSVFFLFSFVHIQFTQANKSMLSNPSISLTNRDLIKEYMARTRAPPPIFKPSFIAISPPPSQLDAIAYTHPRLLMDYPPVHELDYINTMGGSSRIQYIDDDNSIELLDASKNVSKSTPKIADDIGGKPPRARQHRQAFASIVSTKQPDSNTDIDAVVACKLIGKVNPTLVKTWEQLNRKVPMERAPTTPRKRSTSNSSDDRILYPETDPKMTASTSRLNGNAFGEHYRINVVIHSESSEDFYDSIDADDEHFMCDAADVPSMCASDGEYLAAAAGDVMADDLLDKRKMCWSIDSESRFSYKKDVT